MKISWWLKNCVRLEQIFVEGRASLARMEVGVQLAASILLVVFAYQKVTSIKINKSIHDPVLQQLRHKDHDNVPATVRTKTPLIDKVFIANPKRPGLCGNPGQLHVAIIYIANNAVLTGASSQFHSKKQ